MRDAAIINRGRQVPVHKAARVVICSARADPQRGYRAYRETTVPTWHAGSGGATKLTGEIGLLLSSQRHTLLREVLEKALHFDKRRLSHEPLLWLRLIYMNVKCQRP